MKQEQGAVWLPVFSPAHVEELRTEGGTDRLRRTLRSPKRCGRATRRLTETVHQPTGPEYCPIAVGYATSKDAVEARPALGITGSAERFTA